MKYRLFFIFLILSFQLAQVSAGIDQGIMNFLDAQLNEGYLTSKERVEDNVKFAKKCVAEDEENVASAEEKLDAAKRKLADSKQRIEGAQKDLADIKDDEMTEEELGWESTGEDRLSDVEESVTKSIELSTGVKVILGIAGTVYLLYKIPVAAGFAVSTYLFANVSTSFASTGDGTLSSLTDEESCYILSEELKINPDIKKDYPYVVNACGLE